MLRTMQIIRCVEQTLLDMFAEGRLHGTIHTCIGQEHVATEVLSHICEGDVVFGNHRSHGHAIAYGMPLDELFYQIMYGAGGSQHLHWKNFYTNGVQGGIVPNAAGAAYALKGTGNIAVVFMGDGTLGQGVVYETLNMASLWKLPIVFVVDDNQYALSTRYYEAIAGSIRERFEAFNVYVDDDVEWVIQNARRDMPMAIIYSTYRLAPHSKGDDTRDAEEIAEYWKKDKVGEIPQDIKELVDEAVKKAGERFESSTKS